jgi:adenine-specific DNA methylase
LVPNEKISLNEIRRISVPIYGMATWGDLFTPRQALAITAFIAGVGRAASAMADAGLDEEFARAVTTCLALVPNRCADFWSSLTRWIPTGQKIGQTFGRQAIPMVWDFVEGVPFADISGAFLRCLEYALDVLKANATAGFLAGHVQAASATAHPLPDDSANAIIC